MLASMRSSLFLRQNLREVVTPGVVGQTLVYFAYVLLLSQDFRAERKLSDLQALGPIPSICEKRELGTFKGFVQAVKYVAIQGQKPRSSGFLPILGISPLDHVCLKRIKGHV